MKICYKNVTRWKYQTTRRHTRQTRLYGYNIDTPFIKLNVSGLLTIEPDYFWNGADKPAWNNQTIRGGSAIHDALYQLIWMELLPLAAKPEADRLFNEICIEDGMNKIRAWWTLRGVKRFGLRRFKTGQYKEQPEICSGAA